MGKDGVGNSPRGACEGMVELVNERFSGCTGNSVCVCVCACVCVCVRACVCGCVCAYV